MKPSNIMDDTNAVSVSMYAVQESMVEVSWTTFCVPQKEITSLSGLLFSPKSLIVFDERVTFWLQRVHSLHSAPVYVALFARGSCITITQSHTHAMQQTHMHKAVVGRVEAKKLLPRRRQSDNSNIQKLLK